MSKAKPYLRLTQPLVRDRAMGGALRPATWDEALDRAARGLKGVRNGARLYALDPRRTSSAQWADAWAALDVGTDIALANAVAREIIAAGLENKDFIENATTGFDEYRRSVESYTLEYAERET